MISSFGLFPTCGDGVKAGDFLPGAVFVNGSPAASLCDYIALVPFALVCFPIFQLVMKNDNVRKILDCIAPAFYRLPSYVRPAWGVLSAFATICENEKALCPQEVPLLLFPGVLVLVSLRGPGPFPLQAY